VIGWLSPSFVCPAATDYLLFSTFFTFFDTIKVLMPGKELTKFFWDSAATAKTRHPPSATNSPLGSGAVRFLQDQSLLTAVSFSADSQVTPVAEPETNDCSGFVVIIVCIIRDLIAAFLSIFGLL